MPEYTMGANGKTIAMVHLLLGVAVAHVSYVNLAVYRLSWQGIVLLCVYLFVALFFSFRGIAIFFTKIVVGNRLVVYSPFARTYAWSEILSLRERSVSQVKDESPAISFWTKNGLIPRLSIVSKNQISTVYWVRAMKDYERMYAELELRTGKTIRRT